MLPLPPQPQTITTTTTDSSAPPWVTSSGDIVISSIINDPANWNPEKQEIQLCSRASFGNFGWLSTPAPPPNFIRRLIWKWALGVTWRDLRPERQIDDLRRLK